MKIKFWQNKNIVITGTSSGIGESLLMELKDIPCRIFALDRSPKKIEFFHNAEIIPIQCDISLDSDIIEAQKQILSKTDTVDVLFNNAGITTHGRFDETDISVFRKTFDINFFGTVHLTSKLIESIKKAKGVIVVTSTVSGLYGVPGRAAYSSSKSALHAVFESIRIELSEFGVRSILFCPPYTKTNLRTSGLTGAGEKLNDKQYKGNLLTPNQVAKAMIDAAEDPNARLVTMDPKGFFVKILRLFAPALLEKQMFKKLYADFHH
ncbi:MAG TPA: SDR family NAD(P)-dependent oxidoreductase [Leptospiraceae bacterium]|nr:SDR family NAD(P)-dependent oxidoreductase [Leptospiraceae bacterium]HMW03721.1 SDR family NAD(P)-dependent oxidoreductase [Leptospiraceae bacterium]HMX31834.1 SDR family NAD(P)-dependent oxidoreductase [Leptospiraceae bacterium]HMY29701.1 SDR family NAD(P)-dependent oxidoreductase [Leptospiraceae bacterium]HMZ64023.1 SDR family NAD(P)-dependent oxidoreductase [Leptospiraceae bacterium]